MFTPRVRSLATDSRRFWRPALWAMVVGICRVQVLSTGSRLCWRDEYDSSHNNNKCTQRFGEYIDTYFASKWVLLFLQVIWHLSIFCHDLCIEKQNVNHAGVQQQYAVCPALCGMISVPCNMPSRPVAAVLLRFAFCGWTAVVFMETSRVFHYTGTRTPCRQQNKVLLYIYVVSSLTWDVREREQKKKKKKHSALLSGNQEGKNPA